MDAGFLRIIPIVCAAIGVVSTIAYYVFKFKELRVLREIRDRLDKQTPRKR